VECSGCGSAGRIAAESVNVMNLAVLQTALSFLALFTLMMAARSGVTTERKNAIRVHEARKGETTGAIVRTEQRPCQCS
jgi:hypothetical protein